MKKIPSTLATNDMESPVSRGFTKNMWECNPIWSHKDRKAEGFPPKNMGSEAPPEMVNLGRVCISPREVYQQIGQTWYVWMNLGRLSPIVAELERT